MQSTEQKYPVAIFELIPLSKTGSGFVREDTVQLPEHEKIRIIHPKNRVIQNESIVRKESEKTPGTFVNVPTRYIYNQEEIDKATQETQKMTTSLRDKVVFINGFLTVPKDGAFVGLYAFMKSHAQNLTNPDRNETLQPIFKEIQPAKSAHDNNLVDLHIAEAMGIVLKLVKEEKGGYVYDEAAIAALCENFGINADTPQQQVASLIALAKTNPAAFLSAHKQVDQTVGIEIKHALQLGLIKIDGSAIMYEDGSLIKNYSNVQNTDDKKLAALVTYFKKQEGKEAYQLFKEKLMEAKAKAI